MTQATADISESATDADDILLTSIKVCRDLEREITEILGELCAYKDSAQDAYVKDVAEVEGEYTVGMQKVRRTHVKIKNKLEFGHNNRIRKHREGLETCSEKARDDHKVKVLDAEARFEIAAQARDAARRLCHEMYDAETKKLRRESTLEWMAARDELLRLRRESPQKVAEAGHRAECEKLKKEHEEELRRNETLAEGAKRKLDGKRSSLLADLHRARADETLHVLGEHSQRLAACLEGHRRELSRLESLLEERRRTLAAPRDCHRASTDVGHEARILWLALRRERNRGERQAREIRTLRRALGRLQGSVERRWGDARPAPAGARRRQLEGYDGRERADGRERTLEKAWDASSGSVEDE
jgi:hypothetical protein